jgi:TetR/AcrR family transcriptional regulator
MVSQRAPLDPPSRDRILAAAAAEFAARGFDGAKVDRIAARARVNKAMLYYHFKNKADLYRAILRDLFQSIAAAVAESRAQGGPPADQLRRYIRAMAAEAARRPFLPPIWLREMAEGGRHLDASVISHLTSVLGVLAAIVRDGHENGVFDEVHPFILQMSIVAPLLMFSASAPVRERFAHVFPPAMASATREAVVAHIEASALAALAAGRRPAAVPVVSTQRSRR